MKKKKNKSKIEKLTKKWVIEYGFSEPDKQIREYVTSARAHKKG